MHQQDLHPLLSLGPRAEAFERRVCIRFPSEEEALCHLGGGIRSDSRWARVRDVSASGVGLLIDTPLEPGRRVTIEFPQHRSSRRRALRARVIHCLLFANGRAWLAGCRFETVLEEQEVQVLAALAR